MVRRVLRVVQGHPKLLELADAAAADRDQLEARLDAAEQAAIQAGDGGESLRSFFEHGHSTLDPEGFLNVLTTWTTTTLASLPAASALLLQALCYCEEDDRTSAVLDGIWTSISHRANQLGQPSTWADALAVLTAATLIDPETISRDTDGRQDSARYRIHAGVAEVVRARTDTDTQAAIDTELAAYWLQQRQTGLAQEGGEASRIVVRSSLAAARYLLRLRNWDTACDLLEGALTRDIHRRSYAPWCRRCAGSPR